MGEGIEEERKIDRRKRRRGLEGKKEMKRIGKERTEEYSIR